MADYDEIVKRLRQKDDGTEKIENTKKNLETQCWSVLQNYYESKSKYELGSQDNSVTKMLLNDKMRMRNGIDSEQTLLDDKLQKFQHTYITLKDERRIQRNSFFKAAEELYQEINNIPNEFNNEKIHETVRELKESIKTRQQEIAQLNEQMDVLNRMSHNEYIDDLSNIRIVTQIIQSESKEKYGDLTKLQHSLAEMKQKNDDLLNKIHTLKLKYGI